MPNMHVSLFIRPADRINASSMAHNETESFSVTVKVGGNGERSEIALFADSLAQLAEFGRAIVRECEKLAPVEASDPFLPNEADQSAVTHDFRPGAYAINDAVQHDEAMVNTPPNFDPNAWLATQEPAMAEALSRIAEKDDKPLPF